MDLAALYLFRAKNRRLFRRAAERTEFATFMRLIRSLGGFVSPDPTVQARNKIGLGIDNVYEAGEIAAIPRLLLKGPGTACNPRIRTVHST
jgi:hypothetical protein